MAGHRRDVPFRNTWHSFGGYSTPVATDHSVALPAVVHRKAASHLLRDDGQEDLCFALWHPSRGTCRFTALVSSVIIPRPGEHSVHGNVSFNPAFLERALREARRAKAGLAFMHSHPAAGWQGMSRDDVSAERGMAGAVWGATRLPLVGLTIGTDGAWSARFWPRTGRREYKRRWARNVRTVGDEFHVTWCDELAPRPSFKPELSRTISAWGSDVQSNLARIRIAVVGLGSVGSIVAEALARMGVQDITLLDFDAVELVNLDRVLHATRRDVGRAKVDVAAQHLRYSATADTFRVRPLEWSVVEEEGFRAALDADVIFSCVDRPWPRFALNLIAYAHLIPVVDGGIRAAPRPSGQGLRRADIRAHIGAPQRRCLECIGQYLPEFVSVERDGFLDDPHYIESLPDDHVLRRNENVFSFGLTCASLEMMQFLAMVVRPLGIGRHRPARYHMVIDRLEHDPLGACEDTCVFPSYVALGDHLDLGATGPHRLAEEARAQRKRAAPSGPTRRSLTTRLRDAWVAFWAQGWGVGSDS